MLVGSPEVLAVQVMPSGEVMTRPCAMLAPPTATKRLLPKVTEFQGLDWRAVEIERLVQVMPSDDVMTRDVPVELTATNKLFPKVTEFQLFACTPTVLAVQVMPLFETITWDVPVVKALTPTKIPLPVVIELNLMATERFVQVDPSVDVITWNAALAAAMKIPLP